MFRLLLLLACIVGLSAAVSIDGPSTARAIVGVPFTCAILTSGSVTAYTASGLPAGLTLDSASGRITGTPTTATGSPFTINLGATGATGIPLTLTVDVAGTGSVSNAGYVSITENAPSSIQLLSATAAPTFSEIGLPSGLSIDAVGLITGAPGLVGTYNVEISADSGTTATTMVIGVTIRSSGVPVLALPVQPQATAGAPFACWIHATDATNFSATGQPGWLILDAATGLLSGTPTSGLGGVNVSVAASNAFGTCTGIIAIPITTPGASDPVFRSPAVLLATEGSGVVWRAIATQNATWSAGSVPAALTLDISSGELTGIPAIGGTAGLYNMLLSAINPTTLSTFNTTLALRVLPAVMLAPTITAIAPPPLTVSVPAVIAMQTADGVPTSYSLVDSSGTFTVDSTGLISGTPTIAGIVTLQLTARNSAGSATTPLQTMVLAATTGAPLPIAPLQWTVTNGSAFAASLLATGTLTGWSINGLPTDVDPDLTTGRLIGRPTTTGRSNVLLSASNGAASNQTHAVLTVTDNPAGMPQIRDAGPWFLTVGQAATLVLIDNSGTSRWSATSLPAGLSLGSNGVIRGTPTAAALAQPILRATRSGKTAQTTALMSLTTAISGAPVITGPGSLTATADQAFTATLIATGSPVGWTVTGRPIWLSLDPATGTLSGTPTTTDVATTVLQVAAFNASGTSNTTMVLSFGPLGGGGGGGTTTDGVSGVSGGGCGAGAAGLVVLGLLGWRRRRLP